LKFDDFGVVNAFHDLDFSLDIFPVDWVFEDSREYLFESKVFAMQLNPIHFRKSSFTDILFLLPLVIYAHSLSEY
jgi:hypothetical protein